MTIFKVRRHLARVPRIPRCFELANRQVQFRALHALNKYVAELGLQINVKKTEAMKFRRGGRLAEADRLTIGTQRLQFVNSFTYLGVTLSLNGKSFTSHVRNRLRKALAAASSIKDPSKLSIETALRLFELKVSPTATYGVQLFWEKLSAKDFSLLDRIKPTFLKRVLGLRRSAQNRVVYLLVGTPLFVEDLVRRYGLRETGPFKEFIRRYEDKLASIDHGLFYTVGMNSNEWKGSNQRNRHIVARLADHGFHAELCTKKTYHEPDENCRCQRCGEANPKYHASQCKLVVSLASLAKQR